MTNSEQHLKKASPKQHRLLRELAAERGVSFAYPQTSSQAAGEIRRLKAIGRQSRSDRRRDTRAVRDAMASGRGDAARIRADELGGFGSNAHFR